MSDQSSKAAAAARFLGVNYGSLGDNLPPPAYVAKLLASHGITKVKLYDSNAGVISALVSSPTTSRLEISITLYNEAVWELSSSPAAAASWVERNRASLPPAVSTVYVGNEVLTRSDPSLRQLLVAALANLHSALNLTVTTTHALDVLDMATSFPPSNARFADGLQPYLDPLLDFLARTGSPFVVDAYPYFAYRDDHGKGTVELGYALLDAKSRGVTDLNTKLHYTNMLDAMVDAVYAAMAKMGHHGDVRVVVGETGWPSAGNSTTGAGRENAAAFVGNLVSRLSTGRGTPMQPGIPLEAYIFALFNEDLKQGSEAERNFGLFYPNMTQVYNVSLNIAR